MAPSSALDHVTVTSYTFKARDDLPMRLGDIKIKLIIAVFCMTYEVCLLLFSVMEIFVGACDVY
jgi:hypothetical protein